MTGDTVSGRQGPIPGLIRGNPLLQTRADFVIRKNPQKKLNSSNHVTARIFSPAHLDLTVCTVRRSPARDLTVANIVLDMFDIV